MTTSSENVQASKPACFGKLYSLEADECKQCDALESCKIACSVEATVTPEPEPETVPAVSNDPIQPEVSKDGCPDEPPAPCEPQDALDPVKPIFKVGTVTERIFELFREKSPCTSDSLVEAIKAELDGKGGPSVTDVLTKLRKLNLLTKEGRGKDATFTYCGE